jgi:hypothetical protein
MTGYQGRKGPNPIHGPVVPPVTTAKLNLLMLAIEHREGYGHAGNLPTRTNNPGDLMFAHQIGAKPYPVVGTDGKTRVYASFTTIEAGLGALRFQILLDAGRGQTVEQFINGYAPASDGNDPNSYLAFCMKAIDCTDKTIKLSAAIA